MLFKLVLIDGGTPNLFWGMHQSSERARRILSALQGLSLMPAGCSSSTQVSLSWHQCSYFYCAWSRKDFLLTLLRSPTAGGQ